jgi:AraC family transcriptional regulator of adaptative response / DNA-3-methyladenine glycosylase II
VAIGTAFRRDPLLGALVRRRPGVRVPAAWDPFELAVRAIVGQQVTVRAATTMMGGLVARVGRAVDSGVGYAFPTPAALAAASTADLGVTSARAEAIRALARAVDSGAVRFGSEVETADVVKSLTALPGIGDWTAHYIAMRGLSDPDAFPTGDLGLRIAAGNGHRLSARELTERAEPWRPWRAYAAMHLWQSLSAT